LVNVWSNYTNAAFASVYYTSAFYVYKTSSPTNDSLIGAYRLLLAAHIRPGQRFIVTRVLSGADLFDVLTALLSFVLKRFGGTLR